MAGGAQDVTADDAVRKPKDEVQVVLVDLLDVGLSEVLTELPTALWLGLEQWNLIEEASAVGRRQRARAPGHVAVVERVPKCGVAVGESSDA